jgi:hypothetical protein
LGSTLTWGPGSSVEIAGLEVETAGTEVALQFTPEEAASSGSIVVFYAPGQTVALNGNGTTTFYQSLYLEAHEEMRALPIDGFAMSLAHGPQVAATAVMAGAALSAPNPVPDFFEKQIITGGITVGVVVSFGLEVLLASSPVEVVKVTYQVLPGQTGASPVAWEDLGIPLVENVVSIVAASYYPQLPSGSFLLVEPSGSSALEVDCENMIDDDGDGLIDCFDPDCAVAVDVSPIEFCCNGLDDDNDGLVDCDDSDCVGIAPCP